MRNPKFTALIEEISRLHDSKNHDYAHDADPLSNLRRAQAFGIDPVKGVLVRLSDKWSRIEQLAAGKTAKHESLRDSLIDNAVYSLLAIILLDEQSAPAAAGPPSRPPAGSNPGTALRDAGFGGLPAPTEREEVPDPCPEIRGAFMCGKPSGLSKSIRRVCVLVGDVLGVPADVP